MNEQNEKRISEAFAAYERGASLEHLKATYADVMTELDAMIETHRLLLRSADAMKPSRALVRSVVAAYRMSATGERVSIFASRLWRLAAPVGIAALSFMFVISNQSVLPEEVPALSEDAVVMEADEVFMGKRAAPEAATFAVQSDEASLMTMSAPAGDFSQEAPVDDTSRLYMFQMISLGLLLALSILVLIKHWLVLRR